MPMQTEPPIPMDEVLRWCEANRPDVVDYMKALDNAAKLEEPVATATLFVLSVAFNAGRTYQRAPAHADVFLPINKDPYTP